MATKKTYREAHDLSKLNPNQVMDMILHDPKIDDNTFRSIAMMAGATVEDIFKMDTTSQMAIPRKKEELILHMHKQQNKPSGLRVTPLLGLVSTGAIAWYVNHIASQHNQTLTLRNSSSTIKTKKRKQGGFRQIGGADTGSGTGAENQNQSADRESRGCWTAPLRGCRWGANRSRTGLRQEATPT